jgi:hypothetical protein
LKERLKEKKSEKKKKKPNTHTINKIKYIKKNQLASNHDKIRKQIMKILIDI